MSDKTYYHAKEFLRAAFRAFEAKDGPGAEEAMETAARAFEAAVIDTADDREDERYWERKRSSDW